MANSLRALAASGCGGCKGMGRHKRHCPNRPYAHRASDFRFLLAERAESLGDSIGANNIEAANLAYACAGVLRQQAREIRREKDATD